FVQAEDGIRDRNVTGVQTCALPIEILTTILFHSSSAVEQSAVNRSVAGSNPACGAIWRRSSAGESVRFIPERSWVRSPPPLFFSGPLAQLVRAIGSYPIGRRFESCRVHRIYGGIPKSG